MGSDNVSLRFDALRLSENYSVFKGTKFEICAHVHIIMPPLNIRQEHVQ